jgi:hypothetical protein
MPKDETNSGRRKSKKLEGAEVLRGAYRIRDPGAFARVVCDLAREAVVSSPNDRLRATYGRDPIRDLERLQRDTDDSNGGGWVNFHSKSEGAIPRGAFARLAEKVGCSPATITRWSSGRAEWAQKDTIDAMLKMALSYQRAILERCLCTPGQTEADRLEQLATDVVGHCEREFEPLRQALGAEANGESGKRAVHRVVGPLIGSEIARRLQFRPSDDVISAVRRFVRAGVERELILTAWQSSDPVSKRDAAEVEVELNQHLHVRANLEARLRSQAEVERVFFRAKHWFEGAFIAN